MNFNINALVRDNLKNFKPYSSARNEFKGEAKIFLDANENSLGSPLTTNYNRYPDPIQKHLKEKISIIKSIPINQIFLGNGSNEIIDIFYRIFCFPGVDNVIICPPTYSMYEVSAKINNINVIKIPLKNNYELNIYSILSKINLNSKLIFLCSPNNPTGNQFLYKNIQIILKNFPGIVLIDEAYIDFSNQDSLIKVLNQYSNLVIIQTLSKAWGLAGLRIGMLFASKEIIKLINKIKIPYNINQVSQNLAIEAIQNYKIFKEHIKIIIEEREKLVMSLTNLSIVEYVYPSQANFLFIKISFAKEIYKYLLKNGIVVRDRSHIQFCKNCLRITIGTPEENKYLIKILNKFKM